MKSAVSAKRKPVTGTTSDSGRRAVAAAPVPIPVPAHHAHPIGQQKDAVDPAAQANELILGILRHKDASELKDWLVRRHVELDSKIAELSAIVANPVAVLPPKEPNLLDTTRYLARSTTAASTTTTARTFRQPQRAVDNGRSRGGTPAADSSFSETLFGFSRENVPDVDKTIAKDIENKVVNTAVVEKIHPVDEVTPIQPAAAGVSGDIVSQNDTEQPLPSQSVLTTATITATPVISSTAATSIASQYTGDEHVPPAAEAIVGMPADTATDKFAVTLPITAQQDDIITQHTGSDDVNALLAKLKASLLQSSTLEEVRASALRIFRDFDEVSCSLVSVRDFADAIMLMGCDCSAAEERVLAEAFADSSKRSHVVYEDFVAALLDGNYKSKSAVVPEQQATSSDSDRLEPPLLTVAALPGTATDGRAGAEMRSSQSDSSISHNAAESTRVNEANDRVISKSNPTSSVVTTFDGLTAVAPGTDHAVNGMKPIDHAVNGMKPTGVPAPLPDEIRDLTIPHQTTTLRDHSALATIDVATRGEAGPEAEFHHHPASEQPILKDAVVTGSPAKAGEAGPHDGPSTQGSELRQTRESGAEAEATIKVPSLDSVQQVASQDATAVMPPMGTTMADMLLEPSTASMRDNPHFMPMGSTATPYIPHPPAMPTAVYQAVTTTIDVMGVLQNVTLLLPATVFSQPSTPIGRPSHTQHPQPNPTSALLARGLAPASAETLSGASSSTLQLPKFPSTILADKDVRTQLSSLSTYFEDNLEKLQQKYARLHDAIDNASRTPDAVTSPPSRQSEMSVNLDVPNIASSVSAIATACSEKARASSVDVDIPAAVRVSESAEIFWRTVTLPRVFPRDACPPHFPAQLHQLREAWNAIAEDGNRQVRVGTKMVSGRSDSLRAAGSLPQFLSDAVHSEPNNTQQSHQPGKSDNETSHDVHEKSDAISEPGQQLPPEESTAAGDVAGNGEPSGSTQPLVGENTETFVPSEHAEVAPQSTTSTLTQPSPKGPNDAVLATDHEAASAPAPLAKDLHSAFNDAEAPQAKQSLVDVLVQMAHADIQHLGPVRAATPPPAAVVPRPSPQTDKRPSVPMQSSLRVDGTAITPRREAVSPPPPKVIGKLSEPPKAVLSAVASRPHARKPLAEQGLLTAFPGTTARCVQVRNKVRDILFEKLDAIGLGMTLPEMKDDVSDHAAAESDEPSGQRYSARMESSAIEALALAFEKFVDRKDKGRGTSRTRVPREHTVSAFDFTRALGSLGLDIDSSTVADVIAALRLDAEGRVNFHKFIEFVSMPLHQATKVQSHSQPVLPSPSRPAYDAPTGSESTTSPSKRVNSAHLATSPVGKSYNPWNASVDPVVLKHRPKFSVALPLNIHSSASPFWNTVNALEAAVMQEVRKRATIQSVSSEPTASFDIAARYGTHTTNPVQGAFVLRRAFAFFDRRGLKQFTVSDLHTSLAELGLVDPPLRADSTFEATLPIVFAESDELLSPVERIVPEVRSPTRVQPERLTNPTASLEVQLALAAKALVTAVYRRMHGEGDPGIAHDSATADLSPSVFEQTDPIVSKPVTYNVFSKWALPLNSKLRKVRETMQEGFRISASLGGGAKDFVRAFKRISGDHRVDEPLGIDQLRAVLGLAARPLTDDEIQCLIDYYDENGNGQIDMIELFSSTIKGWDIKAIMAESLAQEAQAAKGDYVPGPSPTKPLR